MSLSHKLNFNILNDIPVETSNRKTDIWELELYISELPTTVRKGRAMAGSGFWRWGNIEKGSPSKSLRGVGEKPKESQKKVQRGAVVINVGW